MVQRGNEKDLIRLAIKILEEMDTDRRQVTKYMFDAVHPVSNALSEQTLVPLFLLRTLYLTIREP